MRKERMKRKFQSGEINAERRQGKRARESHGRIADGTFVCCLQPTGQRVNMEQRIARVFMCSHVGAQRGCPRRGSECIKIRRNEEFIFLTSALFGPQQQIGCDEALIEIVDFSCLKITNPLS